MTPPPLITVPPTESVVYFGVLSKIFLEESVSRLKPSTTLQFTFSKAVFPNLDLVLLTGLKIDIHLQLRVNHN